MAQGVQEVKQQTRVVVVVLVIAVLLVVMVSAGGRDLGAGHDSGPLAGKTEGAAAIRDGRDVSAPTATLLAGGLALLGVVLGLFGDRYLRHRGDIQCRSSNWSMAYTIRDDWNPVAESYQMPLTRATATNEQARIEYGSYSCTVKLFNETEVATGLREIEMVFTNDSGAAERVYASQDQEIKSQEINPEVLNLPARQWVEVTLAGRVETEDFEALARSTTAKMRAWLPRDKPFERRIARLWA